MAEALKRTWPEGALSRSRLSDLLSENEKFRMSTKDDLTRGLTPDATRRHGSPGGGSVLRRWCWHTQEAIAERASVGCGAQARADAVPWKSYTPAPDHKDGPARAGRSSSPV